MSRFWWWYDPTIRTRVLAGGAVAMVLVVASTVFLLVRPKDEEEPCCEEPPVACVELIGFDRSASQGSAEVADRWRSQIAPIVNRAARCREGKVTGGKIWVETVHARPGEQQVGGKPMVITGPNKFIREQKRKQAVAEAERLVTQYLATPAAGATNLFAWFKSAEAHLEDEPGDPQVRATLFSDGINTVGINMTAKSFLSADIDELIRGLKLPDCNSWEVRVLGANTTAAGGVPQDYADKAEEFWRAYVEACGGEIRRYDVATG
jgi:hypothetical protein